MADQRHEAACRELLAMCSACRLDTSPANLYQLLVLGLKLRDACGSVPCGNQQQQQQASLSERKLSIDQLVLRALVARALPDAACLKNVIHLYALAAAKATPAAPVRTAGGAPPDTALAEALAASAYLDSFERLKQASPWLALSARVITPLTTVLWHLGLSRLHRYHTSEPVESL